MGFCAAFTSTIRAVSRPSLIVPAGLVATLALLSPPAIDDASAQGFRMQGSRGSVSGGPGRFQMPGGMSAGMMSKSGMLAGMSGSRRPGGNNNVAGTHSGGMGGMGGMASGGGRHPGTNVGDTRPPKGGHRHPRWPRFPIPPIYPPGDTVVSVPGGPASPPPPNVRGGGGGAGGSGRPPSNQPPTNWGRYVPNEVVVEVASNVSPRTINALLRRHRLTQLEAINLQSSNTSIRRLRINDRRPVPNVVRALAAEGFTVQPNLIASLQEARSAPASASDLEQYALARMRMSEAHELANGHRVLIAVIDGGADTEHPELAGLIVDTFDAIGRGDRVHPHGTSIVGAIAARARLRGTAPGAHILVARAFGTQRSSMDGTTTDIVKAIDWAMQRGARVINMSFAGGFDPSVDRRLNLARQRGIILVAAAGNAGPTSPALFPAASPGVIAVTATDEDDRIYRAAVRGSHIAIAAPGVNLMLPALGGDYRMTSGTSFSAAEITGVIALMLERNPGLNREAVRRALISTARDLGSPGIDPLFGAGLVDAYQAVLSVMPAAPAASNGTPATVGVSQ